MTNAERIEYKKAHVELYEIIKRLSNAEKDKIPPTFMNNLKNGKQIEGYSSILDKKADLTGLLTISILAISIYNLRKDLFNKNN